MNTNGPMVFEEAFDQSANIDVDTALPIDVNSSAMGIITRRSAKRTGWLGRILILAFGGIIGIAVTTGFWNFVTNLMANHLILGRIAMGLSAVIVIIIAVYLMRELLTIWRLSRVEGLRQNMRDAWISGSMIDAQKATNSVANTLNTDEAKAWNALAPDIFDAKELLEHCEVKLLTTLDAQAHNEIKRRARQVAIVTAFVPLALADVLTVLISNIGMIRQISEVYGNRPGIIGGWRLFKRVATHLVATGAVAVGDDMIGTMLGGSMLSKVSRRFGEGVINASLTARVGIAAIEVCRPMDFHALKPATTKSLVASALTGFSTEK